MNKALTVVDDCALVMGSGAGLCLAGVGLAVSKERNRKIDVLVMLCLARYSIVLGLLARVVGYLLLIEAYRDRNWSLIRAVIGTAGLYGFFSTA